MFFDMNSFINDVKQKDSFLSGLLINPKHYHIEEYNNIKYEIINSYNFYHFFITVYYFLSLFANVIPLTDMAIF